MGALISYTIESGIVLLACYLIYKWLLSDRNEPSFNRLVILGSYLLAAILPAIWSHLPALPSSASADIKVGKAEFTALTDNLTVGDTGRWVLVALCVIYAAGVVVVGLSTLVSWVRISRILRRGESRLIDGFEVSIIDDSRIQAMSRMDRVLISRTDFQSDISGYILCHEGAHIRLRHSYDLLVARLFEVLMWYNPAAWLMASELRAVHEYQADEAVIASGADPRSYQLMLVKKVVGRNFEAMANNLNHSKLKKRITMMQKSKSSKASRLLAFAMVPGLLVAMSVTRIPAVAGGLSAMSRALTELHSDTKVSEKSGETTADDPENSQSGAGERKVFHESEQLPQYPGGERALLDDLSANLVYPKDAPGDGKDLHRVVLRFIVDTDGSVVSPEIVKSAGEAYDKAALEAVKKLKKFAPGMNYGQPVAVSYVLPVNFRTKK